MTLRYRVKRTWKRGHYRYYIQYRLKWFWFLPWRTLQTPPLRDVGAVRKALTREAYYIQRILRRKTTYFYREEDLCED